MTYNDRLLAALKLAETYVSSQMTFFPKPTAPPLWKVHKALEEAIALAEEGPTLKDLDEELAMFP